MRQQQQAPSCQVLQPTHIEAILRPRHPHNTHTHEVLLIFLLFFIVFEEAPFKNLPSPEDPLQKVYCGSSDDNSQKHK